MAPISQQVSESFAAFVREHADSRFGTALLICADGDAAEELSRGLFGQRVPWPRLRSWRHTAAAPSS